jgi:hypothetical protein
LLRLSDLEDFEFPLTANEESAIDESERSPIVPRRQNLGACEWFEACRVWLDEVELRVSVGGQHETVGENGSASNKGRLLIRPPFDLSIHRHGDQAVTALVDCVVRIEMAVEEDGRLGVRSKVRVLEQFGDLGSDRKSTRLNSSHQI